jgi:replicative DNA helicase
LSAIAKQRHSATGKVKLKFEANITRFSHLAEDGYYAYPY